MKKIAVNYSQIQFFTRKLKTVSFEAIHEIYSELKSLSYPYLLLDMIPYFKEKIAVFLDLVICFQRKMSLLGYC